ncbi:ABC transporter ATP-binding protein [Cellulomonas aerilata]|uniref:ABC transporter ATP-binding protein n=1 Tax=Cellulomonas aerilata TaxID=515326 RepID=UPI0024827E86|nr:ABC transporter ATP-binding protein [Cellulomonas aerilata]
MLRDLSWAVPPGSRTVLLGPNGAGKSTLMKILAGVLDPVQGSVAATVGGRGISGRARRKVVAWMPQDVVPVPGLTVLEQVTYAGWLSGLTTSEASRRAPHALEQVRLNDLAQRRADQISGGQLRRLGLAEVLVRDSSVLLLDEPTAGLDPAQRLAFRQLLQTCPRTLVVSTHQLDDIDTVFDRVVMLVAGRIRFDGTTSEFFSIAGERGGADAEAVFAAFVGDGSH